MFSAFAPSTPDESSHRTTLRWRIVSVLLLASLMPLLLMGVGAWVVFGGMLEERGCALQRVVVQSHARAIESFLSEQQSLLELLAASSSRAELEDHELLQRRFAGLNRASDGGFIDLGVISSEGKHLSYEGPFDLLGRNYRETPWFAEVMANGVFISDVFLGFRQVPHLVIAVRVAEGDESWILRATINSDRFNEMVGSGDLGVGSEAYLVNRDGLYQTSPRVGAVLDQAPLPVLEHSGVREQRLRLGEAELIVMSVWLGGGRWQLVVSQDAAELMAPVRQAMIDGALLALFATLVVVGTTVAATHHLSRQIDRANAAREQLSQAFLRSAKLASVGELATGLAHEINNPLAIISAESTNIGDVLGLGDAASVAEITESNQRIRRQVERCAGITSKMLQFGRQQESERVPTELGPRLAAIADLLERQVRLRNVHLELQLEEGLPRLLLDPVELEQVVVNLINNALYALPRGGELRLRARRDGDEVVVEVEDNGSGMSEEACARACEPFFTTKPVGQGTGLGLSVCHGIVSGWGGRLEIDSEIDMGTTVSLRLPVPAAEDKKENGA